MVVDRAVVVEEFVAKAKVEDKMDVVVVEVVEQLMNQENGWSQILLSKMKQEKNVGSPREL